MLSPLLVVAGAGSAGHRGKLTAMMPYTGLADALDAYQQAMSLCEHLRRLWPLPAAVRTGPIGARRERRARRRAAGTRNGLQLGTGQWAGSPDSGER